MVLFIIESIFIFPVVSFVISLAIFIKAPTEFSTPVREIVPLFTALPVGKVTLPASCTVLSSIIAIATELSALSLPFTPNNIIFSLVIEASF